jgi:heme oxygenase
MISDAHGRLREATRVDHQRLEARLDILTRIASPDDRRALVEGFHALHAEAEAALAPWLRDLPGLEFDARRRSVQLARDLISVGGAARGGGPDPIVVLGVGEALGRMYVLEGSTLGGRVIRKSAEARAEGMQGLTFLDPYGDQVGARWRDFLAVIDSHARTSGDRDAMISGARAGFRHAEQRLCAEPLHV